MFEGVDFFEFKEPLLFFVCNGNQYQLDKTIFIKRGRPHFVGWYPISTGVRNELGKYLSYWDGTSWSTPVSSGETAEKAGIQGNTKTKELYWWFEPWWNKGPVAKG